MWVNIKVNPAVRVLFALDDSYSECVSVYLSGRVKEVACSGNISWRVASDSERRLEAEAHPHPQGETEVLQELLICS